MGFGFFATFVLFLIVVAALFMSGLLGLAPKHAGQKCLQYHTNFVQYNTIRTLGSLTINEPVWKETCDDWTDLPGN